MTRTNTDVFQAPFRVVVEYPSAEGGDGICPCRPRLAPPEAVDWIGGRGLQREDKTLAMAIHDITDTWLRQALVNEATRRWGPRHKGDAS